MSDQFRPAATYSTIVGQILAETRKELGMSQGDLAKALRVKQSAWSKIERGATTMSLTQLAQAANVLKTTPGQLLTKADLSAQYAEERGIHVETERKSDDLIATGLVVIGVAALGAIIAAALASEDDDN